MKSKSSKRIMHLMRKYSPSEPCSCEVCVGFCYRPGWWTVVEAGKAMDAGYGGRMMLEMSLDKTFGVLSPAFKGCEVNFALQLHSKKGCTFLKDKLCELHGTGYEPLECLVSHHARPGLGKQCHEDIGKEWNSAEGRSLVVRWANATGFISRLNIGFSKGITK
jgi:hypothetical protein